MGKRKKTIHEPFESSTQSGRFIKICCDMMESEAWYALNLRQRGLYLEFKSKFCPHKSHGTTISENSQDISMTHTEAKTRLGCSELRTFRSDIDALIECGFIDCVASGRTTRTASIYGLSDRWKQYGKEGYEVPHTVKRPTTVRSKKNAD